MKAQPYVYDVVTRPDICFAVRMVSRYQSNLDLEHWTTIKHILKYLQRTMNYMCVDHCDELVPLGYMDLDFQFDKDSSKSIFEFIFTLGSGVVR